MVIYKITNLITKKIYIGQTIQGMEQRWKQHCNASRKNKYSQIDYEIKKYGRENFSIMEIDSAPTIEELNEKEVFWIKEFNSLKPNGLNLTEGGKNYRPSDEQKDLIGKSLSDKIKNDPALAEIHRQRSESAWKKTSKKLLCHQNNKIYASGSEAARDLGLDRPNIVGHLKGKSKHVKGYTFAYVQDN